MKQGSNRRSRSRSGGKRGGGRNNSFESNGPEVKIRGTAQQVQEKYLALARDAASSGDRITAEAFFQYAEHYYRIANPDGGNGAGRGQGRGGRDGRQQSRPAPDRSPTNGVEVIDRTAAALAAVTDPDSTEAEAGKAPEAPTDPGTK